MTPITTSKTKKLHLCTRGEELKGTLRAIGDKDQNKARANMDRALKFKARSIPELSPRSEYPRGPTQQVNLIVCLVYFF